MGILPKIFEKNELFHAIPFLSDWWMCKESLYCWVTHHGKAESFHFYCFRSCLFTFPNDIVILILFFCRSALNISSVLGICLA